MADATPDLPPSLARALAGPAVPRRSWQDGVTPAYISLLLSVVFLDQLAPGTLLVGGLGPSIVGAAAAGVLGYWMLYYAPAMWGQATGRPLVVVAASTFGARGAAWVPGVLLGVIQVAWFAVAIDYAAEYSLRGIAACGLIDPRSLPNSPDGRIVSTGFLFLSTAAVWSVASAVIGTVAVRLVAAVMVVYPVFPAIVLGTTLVWCLPGVSAGPVHAEPWAQGGGRSIATMIQVVFGFLATYGLMAVEWGAATRTPRDVRLGGMVGVTAAAPILACLALLIVAGTIGRSAPPPLVATFAPQGPVARAARPGLVVSPIRVDANKASNSTRPIRTLRDVFARGIGGRVGGAGLLVLALALLGPACYTPYVIGRQFTQVWPKVPRWAWSLAGAVATWPLIATGVAGRRDLVFGIIGAAAAPAVGAISADYFRRRGRWSGPTRKVNLAGLIAWAVGLAVGLLPWVGPAVRLGDWAQSQPAAVFAFLAAFLAYLTLATCGLEPTTIALPGPEAESGPSPAP